MSEQYSMTKSCNDIEWEQQVGNNKCKSKHVKMWSSKLSKKCPNTGVTFKMEKQPKTQPPPMMGGGLPDVADLERYI